MFQFRLYVCLVLFCFLSWKRTKSTYKIRKQQNQKLRNIFFISHDILFQEKNIIKLYFSSFLPAYMGGFYEFHVLSNAKDYAIKPLWQVRSVKEEAVLLKEGVFFPLCFSFSALYPSIKFSCFLPVSCFRWMTNLVSPCKQMKLDKLDLGI